MVTICFMNDRIVAVDGNYSKGKIIIAAIKDITLEEGSLVNGIINNTDEVLDAIKSLESSMKMKDVRIIIDSSTIHYKKMTAPAIPIQAIHKLILPEFKIYNQQLNNKITDFTFISDNDNHKKAHDILCVAADKELVLSYISLFRSAKIKIKKIVTAPDSVILFSKMINKGLNKNYVIIIPNGNFISVYLFIKDTYFYLTCIRTYNDSGSEEYFQEVASIVSSAIQFSKSINSSQVINDAYIYGFDEDNQAKCSQYISDLGVQVLTTNSLNKYVDNNTSETNLDKYFYNVCALIKM